MNVLNLIIDMISVYLGIHMPTLGITTFFTKAYLFCLILWVFIFTYYIFVISSKRNREHIIIRQNEHLAYFRKMLILLLIAFFVIGIFIFILPLYVWSDGRSMYTYGPSATISYFITFLCLIFWCICVCLNIHQVKTKKYLPVFSFIVFAGTSALIQALFPQILLVTSAASFITVLTFFTIENPDIKFIEQLNIAREQADRANKAKTEFLSNMSHEIRTPLNAIVGFSESLKDEKISEDAKDRVNDIVVASSTLLEIVNGVLDISKIEAGKLEIVNTEYHFKKVYDELVSLTRTRIGEKPIEFRLHYDNSIPSTLYGDYARMKQIILNLLTNAAKYTKKGYIAFSVNSVKQGSVCRLIVSVEDSGIGIKESNIHKLFSKFERFDLEKNITIEGTGLGLAITKRLVELMKGKIVVQSIYGKGSKFIVAIDQKVVDTKVVKEDTPLKENINIEGKRILIVDDNKMNLKVASLVLKKYNVQIDTAISGQECLDKIMQGEKYDLILLDDMMPQMSGSETFVKLKEIPSFSIPTIALTANAISGMKEKYLEAGFDDYLAKPIDKIELHRVLQRFLVKK